MKLFVIYIGGMHLHSLLEVHDMRLIVANCIEDTYDELRSSWWGTPASLHLDAWGVLDYADGYAVHIAPEPPQDDSQKLYFVNLGGYDKTQFTELHKNVFVVASNQYEAKQKALQQIKHWESPHRDYLFEVDNIFNVNKLLNKKHFVHLTPEPDERPFEFTCCYNPIGKI